MDRKPYTNTVLEQACSLASKTQVQAGAGQSSREGKPSRMHLGSTI